MELLPILRYIGAIEKITAARGLFGANVHVFVMTEDRAALREFRTQAKPRGWRIYAYEKAIVQTSRRASTNSNLTNVANKLNALSRKGGVSTTSSLHKEQRDASHLPQLRTPPEAWECIR